MSRAQEFSSSWSPVLPSPSQKPQRDPVDVRVLEYVTPFDHNLMCAICYCPFENAARLPCEHVFCQLCINRHLKLSGIGWRPSSGKCPSCRRTIHSDEIVPMPKIVTRMVDELIVRCPLKDDGCNEQLQKCQVQHHVDYDCDYAEVQCPAGYCLLSIQRKDLIKHRCLHAMLECEDCSQSFMERDLESHRTLHCEAARTSCPDCKTEVLLRDIGQHVESCPDAIFPCTAAEFGCDFIARRAAVDHHAGTCALVKLIPFLQKQNERLGAHETALKSLCHRNSILETSFLSIQESLNPSTENADASSSSDFTSDTSPSDSTAQHLLCLHESLREEVSRVSAALSELDARTTMTAMNESLRVKEDMLHMNAAIAGMRSQLHYQRIATVRNQTGGNENASAMSSSERLSEGAISPIQRLSPSNLERSGGGAVSPIQRLSPSGSEHPSGGAIPPIRRMSDSKRQITKL